MRVYASGTRKLLGTGIVDTGSGYASQNVIPVHIGLGTDAPVDVEVTTLRQGRAEGDEGVEGQPRQDSGTRAGREGGLTHSTAPRLLLSGAPTALRKLQGAVNVAYANPGYSPCSDLARRGRIDPNKRERRPQEE